MHPNLAHHLHSEECIGFIKDYDKCSQENRFGRYMGACDELQIKVKKCLQAELEKRRRIGSENVKKRDIEHYKKVNPEFAEKLRVLEELKAQKAAEEAKSKK